MSVSIYLHCDNCNEMVWAGQKNYLYSESINSYSFMKEHSGHNISLIDDNDLDTNPRYADSLEVYKYNRRAGSAKGRIK